MSWRDDAGRELATARIAVLEGNHGKARTCARRAVGIAATHLQSQDSGFDLGPDFIGQIRTIAQDQRFSMEARAAATRLAARISETFTSPSGDPVSDAAVVLGELSEKIREDQERSSDR